MFSDYIGPLLTLLGAIMASIMPGLGSAIAVARAGEAAAGVVTEDPEKFGKLLVLQALPGTQGIYGLLSWFLIMNFSGLLSGNLDLSWQQGLLYMLAAQPIVWVGYGSAIMQGRVAESGVALVAKRPEHQVKGIVMSAMVETYAILALLATVLGAMAVPR